MNTTLGNIIHACIRTELSKESQIITIAMLLIELMS